MKLDKEQVQSLKLLGAKVMIQLEPLPDPKETGLAIRRFENAETDGGRPRAKVSSVRFLPYGKIVNLTDKTKEETGLSIGDTVLLSQGAINHEFYEDRTTLVPQFTGLVLVPYQLIEAAL